MSDDLRMDAYYYGFEATGCRDIDLILSAVACAGKAYHHTEAWMDECRPYPPHEGKCAEEWIQNAAQRAAARIAALEAEQNAHLKLSRMLKERAEAAEAERDRLREVLEAIANTGEGWLNRKRTRAVARAALAETEGRGNRPPPSADWMDGPGTGPEPEQSND